jgi:N-acetylglucosamine kinase-like BadF-type ATPase
LAESPQSAAVFAGFDGGGSTTRALIASADGTLLGAGAAPGSNPNDTGVSAAARNLEQAWRAAWRDAGGEPQPVTAAFFGVAGASRLVDEGRDAELTGWLPHTRSAGGGAIRLDHDLRTALAGGLEGRPGIVLVAGTGSAGFGRDASGRTARCGGGGPLLDDVGSGYWLGLRALQETLRAHDSRADESSLTRAIAAHVGGTGSGRLLAWLEATHADQRAAIAALGRLVLQQASQGDAAAQSLRAEGAAELALVARTLAAKLFPGTAVPVLFTGGLSQDPEYRELVRAALPSAGRAHAAPVLVAAMHPPLVGALLLALESAGVNASAALLGRADARAEKLRPAAKHSTHPYQ